MRIRRHAVASLSGEGAWKGRRRGYTPSIATLRHRSPSIAFRHRPPSIAFGHLPPSIALRHPPPSIVLRHPPPTIAFRHFSPVIAFWHLPPGSARIGYATESFVLFVFVLNLRAAVHRYCQYPPTDFSTTNHCGSSK